jgi:LuxR family transcriptional regulator, maltose regulon positive regulatory protein
VSLRRPAAGSPRAVVFGTVRSYSSLAVAAKTSERVETGRSTASGPVLLETKLTRPPVRTEYVARVEPIELLRAGSKRALTIVAAPPGFGKTTLLAAWLAESERVAWLSLDEDDNDPARFFAYVVAALRTVEPELGASAMAAQRTPGAGLVDVLVPILLNEIAAHGKEVVLVLDDYHLITNDEIREALAYLVDHMPGSFRLVIAMREDPPLPLGRLRARGQLTELRAHQLRFSRAETSAFLNNALGLDLSEEDIERLQVRTEGWPAALYLAALSLRGRNDRSRLIEDFAGDDRHVVDYLTGEVLARAPSEVRSFLLRTSILRRLCGPLCDAVLETEGSGRLLDELERSNLLLVPLDSKRRWYRYHQLFGDLLWHELQRTESDAVPALHRRACGWYAEAGLIVEAASHASAAGDVNAAVKLVGRHWSLFLDQGQLTTVSRWLDALPPNVIADNRVLCFAAAMVTSHMHGLDEAERWLEAADDATADAADDSSDPPLEALRAWLRLLRGDVSGAIEAAQRAMTTEPAVAVPVQVILGGSLWWAQQLAEAKLVLEAGSRTTEAAGLAGPAIFMIGVRAAIEDEMGDAAQAEALAGHALELTHRSELDEHPFSATAHIVTGRTQARQGRLSDATANIERGIHLAERVNAWHTQTYGVLALAEIRHSAHEPAQARRLLTRARAIVAALRDADELAGARIEQTERALRLRPVRERGDGAPFWELSERELAVLRLLPSKLSQREIASELYVSFNTVKTHTRSIFRKLGVVSRTEAVDRARDLGLL